MKQVATDRTGIGRQGQAASPMAPAILDYIEHFQQAHAYPPTIRQIMVAVGSRSTSMVLAQVRQLERDGYLVRRESPRQVWQIIRQRNQH